MLHLPCLDTEVATPSDMLCASLGSRMCRGEQWIGPCLDHPPKFGRQRRWWRQCAHLPTSEDRLDLHMHLHMHMNWTTEYLRLLVADAHGGRQGSRGALWCLCFRSSFLGSPLLRTVVRSPWHDRACQAYVVYLGIAHCQAASMPCVVAASPEDESMRVHM